MLPKEYNWLLHHPEIEIKYTGEYIAIIGESVVSHGKDFKKVLNEAEKYGENPYIHKVPHRDRDLVRMIEFTLSNSNLKYDSSIC